MKPVNFAVIKPDYPSNILDFAAEELCKYLFRSCGEKAVVQKGKYSRKSTHYFHLADNPIEAWESDLKQLLKNTSQYNELLKYNK